MHFEDVKITAVILAGGSGNRMNSVIAKQRMMLGEISVLKRSVLAFEECNEISDIVVVSRECEIEEVRLDLCDVAKLRAIVVGGASRAESASNGFSAVNFDADFVIIHDGARPLVTPKMIQSVIDLAKEKGCATAASVVADTIKLIDQNGKIEKTLDRDFLVRATTPQMFKREIYERALEKNKDKLDQFTDDNMLVESIGESIYAVVLEEANPKITTPEDFTYAELLLKERG